MHSNSAVFDAPAVRPMPVFALALSLMCAYSSAYAKSSSATIHQPDKISISREATEAAPPQCADADYCGFAGDTVALYWYYPNCATYDCGPETWYVDGLPADVGTVTINPPVTTGTQRTLITIKFANPATIGMHFFEIGAHCTACIGATVIANVLPPPVIALSRTTLTSVKASAGPESGGFNYKSTAVTGTGIVTAAPTTSTQNPNIFTLKAPVVSGAPRPGGLASISAKYTITFNGISHVTTKNFNASTFGLSCYYTTLESDWGAAPSSCKKVKIGNTVFSGTVTNPYGLVGTYCRSFVEMVKLNGSGTLNTGTFIQYEPTTNKISTVNTIKGADGTAVIANKTLARDRAIIPKGGVKVAIDSIGSGIVANDTGNAIKGYRIDLYRGSGESVCTNFSNPIAVAACAPGNSKCPVKEIK